ncbi:hypothetical protein MAPG_11969 [Magnaporthiopsis poae ATCC 64411]|uniref:CMP/dCMP-type deaminase domain-containing protein n=1 Tax=Magnaporthiopsis poae (strain ATCC 64411 / 73-15) TaxID=644358 RepID=A0A0C4EGK9_MAGP6|nr:hypothetical protein MAPG_11969 [Magnaporthiopsis poae ATCC 64411]
MELAIAQARKSRPDPGEFAIGALLVNADTGQVLSPGLYLDCWSTPMTREATSASPATRHPRTSHPRGPAAEYCVYTTLESCSARSSGGQGLVSAGFWGSGASSGMFYAGIRTPWAPPCAQRWEGDA